MVDSMNDPLQPKSAQLGPPDLYILPTAERFPGMTIAEGLARLHFALEDGTELHLPTTEIALARLYVCLKGHFGQ
jgi:hypothetical protein